MLWYIMGMLVDPFGKIMCHCRCMDSKTGHYTNTVAHWASLSLQSTAIRRGLKMQPHVFNSPVEHTLPCLPEIYQIPFMLLPYSGPAVVVLSCTCKFLLYK